MEWMGNFHFLRPVWLLALIPLGWLVYKLFHKEYQQTGFETHINQDLLQHLTLKSTKKVAHYPLYGLFGAWLIAVVALAGPTWEKLPQAVFTSESAVVILLDLSPSMMAEDIKPSRIIRAHLKIQELLQQRKDGLTALIVYAGEAHTVTPFTNDSQTISNLLATLLPGILPLPGSNPEMAVELTKDLIKSSRLTKASILLMSDDIAEPAVNTITNSLPNTIDLSIIGIGTDTGSAVPYNGDFLKDTQQQNIIAKRNSDVMQKLTNQTNGYYLPIQADNSDIEFYLRHLEQRFSNDNLEADAITGDRWFESGQLLILLLIPVLLFTFRRGILLSIIFIVFTGSILQPSNLYAEEYQSIWKNNNERGFEAWKKQNYDSASELFIQPQWRASAYYKKGDYNRALELFKQDHSAIGHYNRGNAHALLNQFEEAISAYEEALKIDGTLIQAKTNKELIEKLLEEKEKKDAEEQKQDSQKSDDQSQNSEKNKDDKEGKKDDSAKNKESESNKKEGNTSNSPTDSDKDNSSADSDDDKKEKDNINEQAIDKQAKENLKESDKKKVNDNNQLSSHFDKLSDEEKQELEQLLRKIPDDPSGLLKRKFEYEFQKRKKLYQQEKWNLPENNAHKRY